MSGVDASAPNKASAAKQNGGPEASKSARPKVSTKLMGLKFMQRAQAKKELSVQEKAAKKALQEEQFEIETKKVAGCVVLVEEEPFAGSGRMSFQNFNPEVEKINEEHKVRIQALAAEAAEKADVTETEMANVLGKRKNAVEEVPADCSAPYDQPSRTAMQEPSGNEASKKSDPASVTIHIPKKAKSGITKPSFRSASEAISKKKGRVS